MSKENARKQSENAIKCNAKWIGKKVRKKEKRKREKKKGFDF
jgi:hypothetical protein